MLNGLPELTQIFGTDIAETLGYTLTLEGEELCCVWFSALDKIGVDFNSSLIT